MCLVDRHHKAGPEWELRSLPSESRLVRLIALTAMMKHTFVQGELLVGMDSSDVAASDDIVTDDLCDLHASSIAKAIYDAQISEFIYI